MSDPSPSSTQKLYHTAPPSYDSITTVPVYSDENRSALYPIPAATDETIQQIPIIRKVEPEITTDAPTESTQQQGLSETPSFGIFPAKVICPNCQFEIVTLIQSKAGLFAWLGCIILVLFGCVCGCCLIPFFIPWFKNVQHFCPNCHALIGECRRIR